MIDYKKNNKSISRFYNFVQPIYAFFLAPFYKKDLLYIQTFLNQHQDRISNVLDVGCGAGNLKKVLPKGMDYLGVDLSNGFILKAKQKFGANYFLQTDVAELPQNKKFDCIVCLRFTTACANANWYLDTLSKYLNPKAFLLILDHGKSSLWREKADQSLKYFNLYPGFYFNNNFKADSSKLTKIKELEINSFTTFKVFQNKCND